MLFSTVIPVHNRAHLLAQTLDSALAQDFRDHEIIVVDAGSTDEVPDVCARYRERITVMRMENEGPGAARNFGFAQARGEYVAFLDSDDLWFPWTLETYRHAIEANNRPSFIAGTHVDFQDATDQLPDKARSHRTVWSRDYLAAAASGNLWIGTCAVAIRADVFRAVGGFATGHLNAEDSDLWLRLGAAPGFVHIESPPVFAYRRHAQSAIAAIDRTVRGVLRLIAEEKRDAYPGGAARARARWKILTRHARPASLAAAKAGLRAEAWQLFRETFAWNARLGRAKYLLGFPLQCASSARASAQ